MVMRYAHTNVEEHAHTIDRLPGENLGDTIETEGQNLSMIKVLMSSIVSLHTGGVAGSIPASPTIQSWQTGRVSGFEETAFRLREMF